MAISPMRRGFRNRTVTRAGVVLTTAPAAQVWPGSPQTRTVFAGGRDGHVWRGRNAVGSAAWTWTRVF